MIIFGSSAILTSKSFDNTCFATQAIHFFRSIQASFVFFVVLFFLVIDIVDRLHDDLRRRKCLDSGYPTISHIREKFISCMTTQREKEKKNTKAYTKQKPIKSFPRAISITAKEKRTEKIDKNVYQEFRTKRKNIILHWMVCFVCGFAITVCRSHVLFIWPKSAIRKHSNPFSRTE